MGAWGFVSLAYGIVWGAILIYLFALKRRYASAAAELSQLRSMETTSDVKT
ncbi:MAG TPA: CcmD family protein [Candidatus Binatia bacterium]|nr:CcmD family protein [Candidatus Binatia bacterium]